MGKTNWTLETAKAIVIRTDGVFAGNQVAHPRPGIKVLGAIDYLVKKHGFRRVKEL